MSFPQKKHHVYVLAGPTGSGKSALIRHFQACQIQALDLERICGHDGSVFSPLTYPKQPTSYQFHKQLLTIWNRFDPEKPIFIESELKRIGNLNLPPWLVAIMSEAKRIYIDVDKNIRLERLAEIIAGADPILFVSCLQKLDIKLGPEKLYASIQFFERADLINVANILTEYYDATPGYSYNPDQIALHIKIDQFDAENITKRIIDYVWS
jgi:tRNA 2-selenouridine synthase